MKRRYSILFLIVIVCVVGFINYIVKPQAPQIVSEEKDGTAKQQTVSEECYYILNTDGYVTVYLSDKINLFENTSIRVDEFPPDVQEQLQSGIKVYSIGDVYSFLENYSS